MIEIVTQLTSLELTSYYRPHYVPNINVRVATVARTSAHFDRQFNNKPPRPVLPPF